MPLGFVDGRLAVCASSHHSSRGDGRCPTTPRPSSQPAFNLESRRVSMPRLMARTWRPYSVCSPSGTAEGKKARHSPSASCPAPIFASPRHPRRLRSAGSRSACRLRFDGLGAMLDEKFGSAPPVSRPPASYRVIAARPRNWPEPRPVLVLRFTQCSSGPALACGA
jgi:hypothetical protein